MPMRIAVFVFSLSCIAILWTTYHKDRSVYSSGFSEASFRRIVPKMPEAEVLKLLGPPLSINNEPSPEYWTYEVKPRSNWFSLTTRFDRGTVVRFASNGRVEKVSGPISDCVKPGMTRGEVLAAAGTPTEQTPARRKTFYYSSPPPSGLYRARIITFDDDNLVIQAIAYDTID